MSDLATMARVKALEDKMTALEAVVSSLEARGAREAELDALLAELRATAEEGPAKPFRKKRRGAAAHG